MSLLTSLLKNLLFQYSTRDFFKLHIKRIVMPTVTAAFGLTLTNLGPLTTTFTPAPSCTALVAQSDAGYVLSGNGFSVGDAWYPYGPVACTPQDLRGCLPDGAARQPIRERNGDDQFTLPYNSPAYHCPEGWTVAATATAASISVTVSSISAAGENAQPLVGFSFVLAGFVVTALAPTETMTVCCPRYECASRPFSLLQTRISKLKKNDATM